MTLGLRTMSEDEKRPIGEVGPVYELKRDGGVNDIHKLFLKVLGEKIDEYMAKYEPFCTKCAIRDFMQEVENKERFLKEYRGDINEIKDKLLIKIHNRDFDKYGKKRFVKVRDSEIHERRIDGGMKVDVLTGWNVDYKCTVCGFGNTIVAPTKTIQNKEKLPEEFDLLGNKEKLQKDNKQKQEKTKQEKTKQEKTDPIQDL